MRRSVGRTLFVGNAAASDQAVLGAPERKACVSYITHQRNSLFMNGFVNGKLLLDTGATKTIIRPDVLKRTV